MTLTTPPDTQKTRSTLPFRMPTHAAAVEEHQLSNAKTIGAAVIEYVRQRQARAEIGPISAKAYRDRLAMLVRHAGRDTPVNRVTRRHIERWLEDSHVGPSTKRGYLGAARQFYKWAILNGYTKIDPTANISPPREPRHRPRGIQAALVTQAVTRAPDLRTRLVILLAVQECLRVGEISRVQVGDVDFDQRVLFVREGKGAKDRRVPLSAETADAARRYLETVPGCAGYLIRSKKDPYKGVSARYLSGRVGMWLRATEVNATCHQLRHTGAQSMADDGADLRAIQEILGHANLATTAIYTGQAGLEAQRRAMGDRRYGY